MALDDKFTFLKFHTLRVRITVILSTDPAHQIVMVTLEHLYYTFPNIHSSCIYIYSSVL